MRSNSDNVGCVLFLILIFFIWLMLAGFGGFFSSKSYSGPITNSMPTQFEATPTRWHVQDLPIGAIGCVSSYAIYVDLDHRMWIKPDWTVTYDTPVLPILSMTCGLPTDEVIIGRDKDGIVLHSDSIGSQKWIPGIDAYDGSAPKRTDLLPIRIQ